MKWANRNNLNKIQSYSKTFWQVKKINWRRWLKK